LRIGQRPGCYTAAVSSASSLKLPPSGEPSIDEIKRAMPKLLELIEKWSSEDPAYDRETLPLLLAALEETRASQEPLAS
jgi:hypothetical protein